MRRIVVTYGLIAGGLLSAMMSVAMLFHEEIGFDNGMIVGYTTMVLSFMLVFFGVRNYRDNVAGGTIGFGRALKVGSLIALIATLCYVATWEVVYRNWMPDYMETYAAKTLEKERAGGKSEAELAEMRKEMDGYIEMYRNPFIRAGFTFLEPLPVALLFSLVTAGVLSRKRGAAGAPGMARA